MHDTICMKKIKDMWWTSRFFKQDFLFTETLTKNVDKGNVTMYRNAMMIVQENTNRKNWWWWTAKTSGFRGGLP